jgi:hypothetical protein
MNLHKERTMTIKANIEAKIEELQQEKEAMLQMDPPDQVGPKAKELKELAISAVLGNRDAYNAYMKLFAKTTDELARLIPFDNTENDPVKREARAYLVSNAVCAPATATGLIDNVFGRLDTDGAA